MSRTTAGKPYKDHPSVFGTRALSSCTFDFILNLCKPTPGLSKSGSLWTERQAQVSSTSITTNMNLLQRLLAFFTRRRRAQPPPPQQATPSTNMFHQVGTMTIIGGTFTTIVIGRCTCSSSCFHWINIKHYHRLIQGPTQPVKMGAISMKETEAWRTKEQIGLRRCFRER